MRRSPLCFLALVLVAIGGSLPASPGVAADPASWAVYPVDVTPGSFCLIWEGEPGTTPDIRIFSDRRRLRDITATLQVTRMPLYAGDPSLECGHPMDEGLRALRNRALDRGLMKIRVTGCRPHTTYWYRLHCRGTGGERVSWPHQRPAAVTTARAQAFIPQATQLLVQIGDQGSGIDTHGWLVMAFNCLHAGHGVSAFVGEGAGDGQACLNLANLFDGDGHHWSPAGVQEIILEIRPSRGLPPLRRTVTLDFSTAFGAALRVPVMVDELTAETSRLADLVRVLQMLVRLDDRPLICDTSMIHDRDGDGGIQLGEAIVLLEELAGLGAPP